jgi:hypothetical protein
MADGSDRGNSFNWWLPLFAAVGTFVAFVAMAISTSDTFFYVSLVLLVSLVLIGSSVGAAIAKNRRISLAILSMLVIHWAISAILVMNYSTISASAKWLIRSHKYKSEVLAQQASPDGELKHIRWDDWELPGARDTWVYLVFDPTDALSAAARSHKPGKFGGLPREVTLVYRLESHWYVVQFSTDESWGRRYVLPAEQPAPSQATAEEPPPSDPIPQDSPCADQPRSLSELTASLNEGRAPSAEEEVGTWVEIGYFDNGIEPHYQSLNCTGIMRGKKFEFAMIGESYDYVMELHAVGSRVFRVRLEPNQKGSSEYSIGDDEDGDVMDVYTCRLTQRATLACLIGDRGEEFKKMKVEDSQVFGVFNVP